MTASTCKPRDGIIPKVLKHFKVGFDDPALDVYEHNLYIAARLSHIPEVIMWQGEAFHQLALRAERRGDMERAFMLYGLAIDRLKNSSVLGEARGLRDLGIRTALEGDPEAGLTLVYNACRLHEADLTSAATTEQLAKGERQRRIGQGYLLRTLFVGDINRRLALEELIELTLAESRDFSLRDQQILIDFTIEHAEGAVRRELRRRKLQLNARRHKPIRTATAMARVVIDTQLQLTEHVLSSIIRKEWSMPRH